MSNDAFDELGAGEDSDDEDDPMSGSFDPVIAECIRLLNDHQFIEPVVKAVETHSDPLVLRALCHLCHNLLMADKRALYKFNILNILPFHPLILRRLWHLVLETKQATSIGRPMALITVISKGMRMTRAEQEQIVPILAVFVSLFGYLLFTVHDTEFFGDGGGNSSNGKSQHLFMPFALKELVPMSLMLRDVSLGLVELAYPESRPSIREDYQFVVRPHVSDQAKDLDTKTWSHAFKKTVELLRQFYNRDMRRQFCPDGHWICENVNLPIDQHPNWWYQRRSRLRQYRPFQGLRVFTREEMGKTSSL
jgi:ubiquitin-protein ligase E3 C